MQTRIKPILKDYCMGEGVTAFSTMRQCGYSKGNYASFNINCYCGDEEEAIKKNREALCELLRIADDRLLMPHQVHLTEMTVVDEGLLRLSAEERHEALEGVDALMTNVKGVCIGVSTADCIPVLLYDPVQHAVCAIHAGWRGTVQRIVEKAVLRMGAVYGSHAEDIVAQIGPGIHLESFEVGDEVYEAFREAGFPMELIARRFEKWHIDLPLCNKLQMLDLGLREENIQLSGICTYDNCEKYFSARRLGINSGRLYTGIIM